jgi:crotonobetainyl-CoA:carnitine CoA-transferase CaiB-like acyl-CoA transferase
VYASITGYGQDGPWSDRRAYAIVIHAEMGMTRLRMAQGGQPARNEPFSHADVYAGLECVAGILAALYQRERTGRGQHVDVAMASSLLTVNERVQEELSGIEIEPGGNGIPDSPILLTASGRYITISGDPLSHGGFRTFCRLMEREDLKDDPRFADPASRIAHGDELIAIVQQWVSGFDDVRDLEAAIGKARLAMGVVRSVEEVADSEWAKHRGAIAEVDDGMDGTIRIPDAPWRFSGARVGVAGGPAFRGEHNREVLGELGLDPAAIDALEANGVLSSRPPKRAD